MSKYTDLLEFHEVDKWQSYVSLHMTATQSKDLVDALNEGSSVRLLTKAGETIAEWKGGLGYVKEGRSSERLAKDLGRTS